MKELNDRGHHSTHKLRFNIIRALGGVAVLKIERKGGGSLIFGVATQTLALDHDRKHKNRRRLTIRW